MRLRFPTRPTEVPIVEDKASTNDAEMAAGSPEPTNEKVPQVIIESDDDSAPVTPEFQHGVQVAQATNQVWTLKMLILAYVAIWFIEVVQAFAYGITSTLTPYVTSSFELHSLTATTSIISSLAAGLWKLPYAKLIDIWGRPQGFALMVASCTLGLIMMAACNDVKTYCAAQVFFYVGYMGIDFSLTIFVADTSKLRNRPLMIAYTSSPWLFVTWAYGPAAQSILNTIGFRWGFGIWAIIYPLVSAPLFLLFYYNQKKAEAQGLIPKKENKRTWSEWILHYGKEFDVIGLLSLATGLALFLLAFSLYSYQADGWKSPLIICFFVFGGLLVVAFSVWESVFAPVTFIPWTLMRDRTVIFTFTMVASIYCAYNVWYDYFYSFLIVVFSTSVSDATYITNIYTIGATFWAIVMGVLIRYNGRLKWISLFFGVPITILGVALMIAFRQPNVNIGYIVMSQIFIAFGGGTLVICEQMTVMAVSTQQNIPAILAMEGMISSVGGSIGSAIAGAMWTGIFPVKLARYLPADAQADFASIYGDLTVQASYPFGSPTRDGINRAYGETQRYMLIASACIYSIAFFSVLFWREINVKGMKQLKGRVI